MALGGSHKESMIKNIHCTLDKDMETSVGTEDEGTKNNDNLSFPLVKNLEEDKQSSNKNMAETLYCKLSDMKLNEFISTNVSDRNFEDINQSSDSLSSSASISDSDFTSTDSEDSLALSESESITDVTPLNSPYCDSPLPQSRNIDLKSDEKNFANSSRNYDYDGSGENCHRPEMNVLMKAIEKLEATNSSEFDYRENMMRRRASSLSNEESKRVDLENQRLFKRVISKQNRIRSMYSASNLPVSKNASSRNQEVRKSDGDVSGVPKKSAATKAPKQGEKTQSRRRQKCLSHPSYVNPHNRLVEKRLLSDSLACRDCGKRKFTNTSCIKSAKPQNAENNYDDTAAKSIEMK